MTTTVRLLDQYDPRVAAVIVEELPAGWDVAFAASLDREDQLTAVRRAEVLLVGWAPVDAGLIAAAPYLRLIQKLGVGVDRIDVDTAAARGVAVARLHAANAIPVAEHTVLLILACLRRLPMVHRRTAAGEWIKEECRAQCRQLSDMRVGLLGLGAIGREVARRLAGFQTEVVYYDPVRASEQEERRLGLRHVGYDELLETVDVLSLHLPLVPETKGLIDRRALRRMRHGSYLVNCARGGLVEPDALLEALESGVLAGAALDTFAEEPPAASPLLGPT